MAALEEHNTWEAGALTNHQELHVQWQGLNLSSGFPPVDTTNAVSRMCDQHSGAAAGEQTQVSAVVGECSKSSDLV